MQRFNLQQVRSHSRRCWYSCSVHFSGVKSHFTLSLRCRYNCPANCLNKKGRVWGTLFYDVVSLHYELHLESFHTHHLSINRYIFKTVLFFFSNQVFAELQSTTVPLTTAEDW